ncbi:hypothetical protein V1478_005146 [Vespula squamosa]|uniref:Uncharacterized protein n=1 Tax=Vespula squamosa TaxID=30214 RepID=A0ABD2BDA7_VESSQ
MRVGGSSTQQLEASPISKNGVNGKGVTAAAKRIIDRVAFIDRSCSGGCGSRPLQAFPTWKL